MPGSPRALISKLLVAALGGTGAISLVVWLAPGLVMLGLFLLILPGLFLGAMPTLFFYLVVFAVVWFALQAQPPLIAAFTGLSAVVTVAVGVPAFLNSQTELRLIEAAQRDRSPAFPIRPPVATIALDYEGRSSTSCDEVCQLLLYHHAASRVVVLNSKTPTAYQISSPAPPLRLTCGCCATVLNGATSPIARPLVKASGCESPVTNVSTRRNMPVARRISPFAGWTSRSAGTVCAMSR